MATQTGSTYIFESMADIVKNSSGKSRFSDHAGLE